ncbi:MAG: hypothetical protein ACRCYQ_00465 [Nocardioides sp.]
MTWLHGAGLGLAVGAHVATWGAYKDAPFEGFGRLSFARSLVLAVLIGVSLAGFERTESSIVLLGFVYAVERLGTEYWKLFFRGHRAETFTIPMRFGVFGRPVDHAPSRYAIGVTLTVATVTGCAIAAWLQRRLGTPPQALGVLLAGVSGWLTAVGGAWKDAPIEGFSGWKFLRSPAVATAWAVPLSFLTENWLLLCLSAGGFAVASIETYKAFLVAGRPPGKFDGKPVRFDYGVTRDLLAGAHALLWAGLALSLLYGLFGGAEVPAYDAAATAQVVVAGLSLLGAGLVIGRALLLRPVPVGP